MQRAGNKNAENCTSGPHTYTHTCSWHGAQAPRLFTGEGCEHSTWQTALWLVLGAEGGLFAGLLRFDMFSVQGLSQREAVILNVLMCGCREKGLTFMSEEHNVQCVEFFVARVGDHTEGSCPC